MTQPTTDSARGVDVVAVMAANGIDADIRKRVAELIAADKAYDDAWAEVCNADDDARDAAEERLEAAHYHRQAALAKVTP